MGDSTSYLNTQFARDIVFVVSIGSVIAIDGTVTIPSGKVLKINTGGKITGYGTINGGIIDASPLQHIFEPTLTVNPEGVTGSAFSARWFGANPSVGDNQPLIQKAIDTCVANYIPNLYLPKGNYNISKGLLFYAGPATHVSIAFYGDKKAQTDSRKETWITCTHADNFAIGIHIGKGVVIDGIGLKGVNQLNYSSIQLLDASTTFIVNNSRDNPYSPYAGIVFEPFHQNVIGTDRYPGFESYYDGISAGSGSTSCVVKDVAVDGFTVCRVLGPNGTTKNCESHVFERNWISNCREAFVSCNSQERTTIIRDENIWSSVKTCYHTGKYGNGFGDPPIINTLNIAGTVFEIIHWNATGYSPMLKMENIHAENLYRIGTIIGQANLINCRFHFIDPSLVSGAYGIQSWILNCSGIIAFDSCQLYHYNDTGGYPTRFTGISDYHGKVITFSNSVIGFPSVPRQDGAAYPENYSSTFFDFANSTIYQMSGKINSTGFPTGIFDNSVNSMVPNIGTELFLNVGSYEGKSNQRYIKHKVTSPIFKSTYVHSSYMVTVTKDGREASFNLNHSGAENIKGVLKVGDPLFTRNSITDRFGYTSNGHIGRIKSIDENNLVTIEGLIDGFTTGSYPLYTMFIQHISRPFLGDTTIDSNQITNVPDISWQAGDRLISLSQVFPNGTYITQISGGTVTVSRNAVATLSDEVFSSYIYEESGTSYYYHPNEQFYIFPSGQTIKKGTRLVEMSPSNVLEYICTKSGTFGTTRLPEFKTVLVDENNMVTPNI